MSLPVVVCISGASGSIYGVNLLKALSQLNIKSILVVSTMGFVTAKEELGITAKELISMADEYHDNSNLAANISSGSYITAGVVVAPCSVKTLSSIANCYNDNLITRVSDVSLKERRKTILLFREAPLHNGHISLMQQASNSGCIIMPPVPAFYNKPKTINDIVNHSVFRVLDLLGIENDLVSRWN